MADEFLTVPLAFPGRPGTISPQQLAQSNAPQASVPQRVNSWFDRNLRRYGGPHLYGALMGQPATAQAPARGGLLSGMAELTPGADIRDLLAGSAQLMQGGGMNALEGAGLMGGAVLGTMVPGSVSGYREGLEEVMEEAAPAGIRAYHGTDRSFSEFSEEFLGSGTDQGQLGRGFYASSDPAVGGGQQYLREVDLNIRNPLRLEMPNMRTDKKGLVTQALGLPSDSSPAEIARKAQEIGFDGVELDYTPMGYAHQEYVVFDPQGIRTRSIRETPRFDGASK